MSIIASSGFTKLWLADILSRSPQTNAECDYFFDEAQKFSDYMSYLIANNAGSLYFKLDEHMLEISLL